MLSIHSSRSTTAYLSLFHQFYQTIHFFQVKSRIQHPKKIAYICITLLSFFWPLNSYHVYGQVSVLWEKNYGGTELPNENFSYDQFSKAIQTVDGGYLLGSASTNYILNEVNRGGFEYWIVKTDANGKKQWDKTFGGSKNDELTYLLQTLDGGYLLAGTSHSDASIDKTENSRGQSDYWIVKTDANGKKQWDKTFGGESMDQLTSVIQTTDGGYLLAGSSASAMNGEKTAANQGSLDYWLVKIDTNGKKLWDKSFGGEGDDYLTTFIQTSDGGYLLAGNSNSAASGDKAENSRGQSDYWTVKISGTGNKVWDKTLGGEFGEDLRSVIQNADGSYLLAGNSLSPISGDKTTICVTCHVYDFYFKHFWFVKISETGTKIWDKVIKYKDNYDDFVYGGEDNLLGKVIPVSNGDYIVGGTEGVMDSYREGHGFLMRLDTNGKIRWKQDLWYDNTIKHVPLTDLIQTAEGGYLIGRFHHTFFAHYIISKTSPDTTNNISVESFTLINADTDQDIRSLSSGDTIDMASLPTRNLNIRANTLPGIIGRVVFNFDGKTVTENFFPYAIGGDAHPNNGDYKAWALPIGTHSLQASPYPSKYSGGTAGLAKSITFTVVEKPEIVSFTLINTDNSQTIMEIKEGSVINLNLLPTQNLNIRAHTKPSITGSVVFDLNGRQVIENTPPYALGGDSHVIFPITYKPLYPPLSAGTYTLQATPYTAAKGSGLEGKPLAVTFTVESSISADRVNSNTSVQAVDKLILFPNPGTEVIYIRNEEHNRQAIEIMLNNSKGETVRHYTTTLTPMADFSIDISELPKGLYVIRIGQRNSFKTSKFIKR